METFSASLALCAGNSPNTGEFLAPMPVTQSFGVFFDLRLNKRLSKHSLGWWFETPSRSLWHQCNVFLLINFLEVLLAATEMCLHQCQWSNHDERKVNSITCIRYGLVIWLKSNYSMHVTGWLQKWLNLITAPGSVSNEPGSVTWLATKYLKTVSWRNHAEKLTTWWPQNISFWPKINIPSSYFTILMLNCLENTLKLKFDCYVKAVRLLP